MALNRVILQGRLGADPEVKTTQSGIEVTSFNIAIDRDTKAENGDRVTDWFTVTAWRQTARFCGQYLTKGRSVIIDGRLQARSWEDKKGEKRKATEIVADHVYFADSKRDGDSGNSSAYAPTAAAQPASDTFAGFAETYDDDSDLPF